MPDINSDRVSNQNHSAGMNASAPTPTAANTSPSQSGEVQKQVAAIAQPVFASSGTTTPKTDRLKNSFIFALSSPLPEILAMETAIEFVDHYVVSAAYLVAKFTLAKIQILPVVESERPHLDALLKLFANPKLPPDNRRCVAIGILFLAHQSFHVDVKELLRVFQMIHPEGYKKLASDYSKKDGFKEFFPATV